jgi:hypothetical protein
VRPKKADARRPKPARPKRRATRGIKTLPIPPAQPRKRSTAVSRTATRSRSPRPKRRPQRLRAAAAAERTVVDTTHERTEPATLVPTTPVAAGVDLEQHEAAGARGPYVAVVSEVPGVEVFAEEQKRAVAPATKRGIDHYATDIPVLIVAAFLAGSTLLDWYKALPGYGINVSGWQSGTWGPIITFLALGSVFLIALRRLGVQVSLPVDESLLHEGIGWVSLVGTVIKSRIRPGVPGLLSTSYGVYVGMGAAVLLVVLAGRMSPHAPFVVRPGWHRAKAGVAGIAIIAVVVAGSAVFGTINSADLQPKGNVGDLLAGTVRGRIPDCAKGFPLTEGLKPQYGFGTGTACQVVLSSTKTPAAVAAEFRTLLRSKNYVFTEITGAPGSIILSITKPRCATLAVVPGETGTTVAVALTTCGPAIPTPTPTGSPR